MKNLISKVLASLVFNNLADEFEDVCGSLYFESKLGCCTIEYLGNFNKEAQGDFLQELTIHLALKGEKGMTKGENQAVFQPKGLD